MAKIHCTYTCIKNSKEYACYVWKHNKCAQVSYIMTIWDMRTSNTLTHNHNCLIGTITFEVYPITSTSLRNMLATMLKVFWSFCFYSLHIFLFEHSMHEHIREKRNIQLYKPKHHNFAIPKHTNVIHDWRVLVVR